MWIELIGKLAVATSLAGWNSIKPQSDQATLTDLAGVIAEVELGQEATWPDPEGFQPRRRRAAPRILLDHSPLKHKNTTFFKTAKNT
jgi:hypothetical protein